MMLDRIELQRVYLRIKMLQDSVLDEIDENDTNYTAQTNLYKDINKEFDTINFCLERINMFRLSDY